MYLGGQSIGWVECRDVNAELHVVENSNQLIRYLRACDNLILTNYREFRWYRGISSRVQRIGRGRVFFPFYRYP
ncbi:MAG: hypothetical protein OXF44_11245 [Anaerolineaceae bacterium]|nr:hypothetical protein [Anaerolineaceae bacterium]